MVNLADNNETGERICEFCGSKEGKPRPVGGFIVHLKETDYYGDKILVCQRCHIKYKKISMKSSDTNRKKNQRSIYLRKLAWVIKKMTGN